MATSRRRRRRIEVDGGVYFWTQERLRERIGISVCTADALVPGQHGRWLRFTLPYAAPVCAALGDAYLRPLEATPGTVRRVLVYARDHAEFDAPGITREILLVDADVRRALAMTVDELIDENLRLATAALDDGHGWQLQAPFADLERIVRVAPVAQIHVDDWLACHGERLRAHAVAIGERDTYLRACCARLQIPLEP